MDAGKIDAVFQSSVKPSTNDKYPPVPVFSIAIVAVFAGHSPHVGKAGFAGVIAVVADDVFFILLFLSRGRRSCSRGGFHPEAQAGHAQVPAGVR